MKVKVSHHELRRRETSHKEYLVVPSHTHTHTHTHTRYNVSIVLRRETEKQGVVVKASQCKIPA